MEFYFKEDGFEDEGRGTRVDAPALSSPISDLLCVCHGPCLPLLWKDWSFSSSFLYTALLFCLRRVFVATGLFSGSCVSGDCSGCGVWASHSAVASPAHEHRLWAHGLSSRGSQALRHRLSGCGAQACVAHWHVGFLPQTRNQPVLPALSGRFFTTVSGSP